MRTMIANHEKYDQLNQLNQRIGNTAGWLDETFEDVGI
jgi:hypothetical protein